MGSQKKVAPDASDALAVRQKVQDFLNAAVTGNLNDFKKFAKQLQDDGKGLTKSVEEVKDANDRCAIHFAAREGQTEVCKYLVEELKLDINVKDADGETPLVHAARQGQTTIAKYLIDKGADPSIPSNLGATALHHAAGIGDIELLKCLLSKDINVDLESDAGTPLVWAAGHAQKDAVKILLDHHANPNVETDDGITPLLSAVAAGSLSCLELLIQAGANVNISAGGATPLHIAADYGGTEIIKCLLDAGADPNMTDEDGLKAIEVAATRCNHGAVELLYPVTSPTSSVHSWSIEGIIEHMKAVPTSEQGIAKGSEDTDVRNNASLPKPDLPEVTLEAKAKAAEAKARGDEAFKRKQFLMAVDAYTQAIDFDPTDAVLFSNRSLCWLRAGQPEQALEDAKMSRALRPNWHKACYREGAALLLLLRFEDAANAFYEGVKLEPENRELVDAFREAVEAGRKFHGNNGEAKS